MDPRIAQSGTTEESVDVSESSLAQKEKIFSIENTSRKMSTTTYTLAGKTPVICSSMGTLSGAVSPPVAYAAEAVQTPEGVLLGGKCLTFSKPMAAPGSGTGPSASPSSASPFLIKLAKPAGFLLDTEGSRTYTPLNFSVPEYAHHQHQPPAEDSGSTNQESSFV
ncbi:hypothetical protein EGR_03971 [Echinococcus granulosus]|uniref:Uncharacterized protein n=1 Tax=Echinococcus granulosus TaxID=6210 RepID=W6UJA4_ECHGR|nr:hypothetical protein EGR_03971 [Echinococcus granulosus]EUB61123.1 hypothetical protein EGR_03971 [Echinococcus granulosus]